MGMLLRCGVVVLVAAFGIRHDMPMFVAFVAICGSVSPHQFLSTGSTTGYSNQSRQIS